MSCLTLSYLSLLCLLACADAWPWPFGQEPTATTAPASVHSAQAQKMAKYADGWTQANEKGFQATSKAMQAVNANDFRTAGMQAKVALKAFQTGLSRCHEAQYMADRLPEPASSGATQIIRSAQQPISDNLKCAKLLMQSAQQLQKPAASCFKAWMTTISPMQMAGPSLTVAPQAPQALPPTRAFSPTAHASPPVPASATPHVIQRWQGPSLRPSLTQYSPSVFATAVVLGATFVLLGLLMAGLAGAFLRRRTMRSVVERTEHLTETHSLE